MGSGSSRMAQRKLRLRHQHRSRRGVGLAALICGGCGGDAASSSSDESAQMRGNLEEKSANHVKFDDSAKIVSLEMPINESSSNYSQVSSSTTEGIKSGRGDNDASKCSVESCLEMFCSERNPDLASTSRKPVEYMDTSFTSRAIDNCSNGNGNHNSTSFPSSIHQLELGDSHECLVNHSNDVVSIPSTNRDRVSVIPGLSSTVHVPSEQPLVLTTVSSNVATSTESYGHRNGSVVHADTVSISSDVLEGSGEITNSEPRRDTRRRLWNAISRHSSRRTVDSATLLSSLDTSGPGFRDRWLLDIADPAFEEVAEDDSAYSRQRWRRHGLDGLSWRSRSETRQQLHAGSEDSENGHASSCPSGLHQDGACSCALLMTEASSTRASIARIFVLAEALFEVLDEIHRQPGSLSFSVISVPASESIVNTFPFKIHKKADATLSNDDAEQCHICLADYEDGDKIRILPCHHEYHMCCVDKWLKEIHGVCPLCRRDVSEAVPVS